MQATMISGIYEILNIVNGKRYIGSSANIQQRWRDHRTCLRGCRHHSRHLQFSWNKHGEKVFNFKLIERVDNADLLITREQYYLDKFHPEYNILPFAGSTRGRTLTDETRRKMSASQIGRKHSDETKNLIREWGIGRPKSESTRMRLSKSLTGLKKSPEHARKDAIAQAKISSEVVLEIRKHVSEGKTQSELRRMYTISRATLCRIVNGLSYKWVEGE